MMFCASWASVDRYIRNAAISTKYPGACKKRVNAWTRLQVSYMFIQLFANCYRYTERNGAGLYWFHRCYAPSGLRSANKTTTRSSHTYRVVSLFRLHNKKNRKNKLMQICPRDTLHKYREKPVTVTVVFQRIYTSRRSRQKRPDI